MQLISLDDLRNYLELKDTDTTRDALFLTIIKAVSKRFETYCDREFTKELRTDMYNTNDIDCWLVNNAWVSKKFYLPAYPLDLTTFTATYNGTDLIKDTDYFVWAKPGIVEFYYLMTYSKPQQLSIIYYGGYDKDSDGIVSVPDDLKYACIIQCAFNFKNRKNLGMNSVSMPDGSVSVSTTDLLPEVKDTLNHYKSYTKR